MKFTDQIRKLISQGEIKDASIDLFQDAIGAVRGDPVSIGRIIIALMRSPFLLREKIFWNKMESFLNGVMLSEDERADFSAKLAEEGSWEENSLRLLECIDRVETQQKVKYLVNASRCLLTGFIDLSTYFRICNVLSQTIDEDLHFLKDHHGESNLPYSASVQGLLTSGLMYQSLINNKGDQGYSFTPFAETVNRFAVDYDNVEKYPNPLQPTQSVAEPQPKIIGVAEWEEIPAISVEEIDEIYNN